MSVLYVCIFGRLRVRRDNQAVHGLDAQKVQELFGYLLLHRGHPHPREALAGLLWNDSSAEQARKYLRQALWQLQTAVNTGNESSYTRLLRVEPDWVDINPQADLWLDVAEFEQAFALCERVPGKDLDASSARTLQKAVPLYQGDLLEGCYPDWCMYERERLQQMHLAMLDKLMGYCQAQHEYETAVSYGMRILSQDRASERTHRRLMRLQYLAGDRTAALRQYERCVEALAEELGVHPSRRTQEIYEQIRADRLETPPQPPTEGDVVPEATTGWPRDVVGGLHQILEAVADLQRQIQQYLQALDLTLKRRR